MDAVGRCCRQVVLVFFGLLASAGPGLGQAITSPPIASGVEHEIIDVLERRVETVRSELFAGGAFSGDEWYVYSGLTQSLFDGITRDGWRVRAVGGYGRYHYRGFLNINGKATEVPVTGTQLVTEGLLGYQIQWGPMIGKVFAGISAQTHILDPVDIRNVKQGQSYGAKLVGETWWNIGQLGFASFDGWWSSNYGDVGLQARTGIRVTSWLSLGTEAAWFDGSDLEVIRGGAFAFLKSAYGDVQLAAGVSTSEDEDVTTYASLAYQLRF